MIKSNAVSKVSVMMTIIANSRLQRTAELRKLTFYCESALLSYCSRTFHRNTCMLWVGPCM